MGAASEHDVLDFSELICECRIDDRVCVAEQVGPPGRAGVKITLAVGVNEPRPFPRRDWEHRRGLMMLHLRAGVPNRPNRAAHQRGIEVLRGHIGHRQKSNTAVLPSCN